MIEIVGEPEDPRQEAESRLKALKESLLKDAQNQAAQQMRGSGIQQGTLGKPLRNDRPKCWADCSIEEKIERLREQVKYQDRLNMELAEQLRTVTSRLSRLTEQLETHEHTGGQVVIPIGKVSALEDFYAGMMAKNRTADPVPAGPDKVYF